MATANKAAQPTKVVTPKNELVRFSYAHVFKAEAINDGEPKYSCAILVPKKNKKTLAMIKEAVEAAKADGSKMWNGKMAGLKLPLRDGDEERPDDEAYAGMYFFNASSKTKPSVVDENLDDIMDQGEFYSGCWGRASIKFYPFSKNGNKGVAAGLNHVQKLKDGDNLGGTTSADADFGDDDDDDDMLG